MYQECIIEINNLTIGIHLNINFQIKKLDDILCLLSTVYLVNNIRFIKEREFNT